MTDHHETTTEVSPEGQIVLPPALRGALGWEPGTVIRVSWTLENAEAKGPHGRVVMAPDSSLSAQKGKADITELFGVLDGYSDRSVTIEEMDPERYYDDCDGYERPCAFLVNRS